MSGSTRSRHGKVPGDSTLWTYGFKDPQGQAGEVRSRTAGAAGDVDPEQPSVNWVARRLDASLNAVYFADPFLNAVYFADPSYGWAVGATSDSKSVIIHTNDTGETWVHQVSPTPLRLESVHFVDRNFGWAAGGNYYRNETARGVIVHTTNGGQTWSVQMTSPRFGLNSVHFVDPDSGWAVGEDYFEGNGSSGQTAVFRTTDGGRTWSTKEVSATADGLKDIYFVDQTYGWAVGQKGSVIHTTDGGDTWVSQRSGTEAWLYSVQFIDRFTGWIAGIPGVLKTTDGGNTWVPQDIPAPDLRSIRFVDQHSGWVVGPGVIWHTSDGGTHWELQASFDGYRSYLSSVHFPDPEHGWAVGMVQSDRGGERILGYSLTLGLGLASAQSADEAAINNRVEESFASLAKGDATANAACYTENAVQAIGSQVILGRANIEKAVSEAGGVQVNFTRHATRLLSPTTAIVHGAFEIPIFTPLGKGHMIFTLVKEGNEWLIAALQSGAAPPAQ